MSQLQAMTAAQVAEVTFTKEELFILDVRNRADFEEWKIEGPSIEMLNIPYFELLDGVDDVLPLIPPNKKTLVVCAIEGSSMFIAEQLVAAGRKDVFYLAGGMRAWSEQIESALILADEKWQVYQMIRVGKGCLSYLVISGTEALVIDPARQTEVYQEVANKAGARITHVVDSHLHADHISGGKRLADETGANYYLMKSEGAVFEHLPFEEHQQIQFADVTLQVLAVKTPGHTPGSVSFLINDALLFSGDTLFVSGLGRPDLGGKVKEWAKDLYGTVYDKLANMADEVIVLPGHAGNLHEEMNQAGYIGAPLGQIREQNEQMMNKSEAEFIEAIVGAAETATPPNFKEIIAINRGQIHVSPEQEQQLEIGPNRCALHHTTS
ncbi:hypothetical protein BEP19_01550 [Ammoniphilus oxalaticus]|uniref:Rhodanese domain-containing protein n=1 Tax=Ammoniphilus oxalaticus TaxID=66863 RepID=A0A419SMY8_9BACL|nr:MBL fold metallo-hydrolase [Ammoniphilus oxalaticus]RKD25654.1 hypothetical protein BEP19_01550 [Ammoniphilus oxalaticus]